MSATVYGLAPGEFQPVAGATWKQSDKGGWTGWQDFRFLRDSLSDATFRNKFSQGVRATELDPSIPEYFSRVYLDKTDIRDEGPWSIITVYYAGYAGFETNPNQAQPTNPKYRLSGTLRDVPIGQHPTVAALSLDQRLLIGGVIQGIYAWDEANSKLKVVSSEGDIETWPEASTQPSAGDATDWVKLASEGWRTYPAPSFMWEKAWESEQAIATSAVNSLGKVDSPEGSPPTPSGSRDWMLTDASQEQHGELYRNRLAWELSEPGGWNETVHDY